LGLDERLDQSQVFSADFDPGKVSSHQFAVTVMDLIIFFS